MGKLDCESSNNWLRRTFNAKFARVRSLNKNGVMRSKGRETAAIITSTGQTWKKQT
jgi:hypothetical protein